MTDRDKALELLEQAATICADEQPHGHKLTYQVRPEWSGAQITLRLEVNDQLFEGGLAISTDLPVQHGDPLQEALRLLRKAVNGLREEAAKGPSAN